jgi:OHCU decarboxylase
MLERADRCFDALDSDDWLEAFAAHPRIGEKGAAIPGSEQAGAAGHEAELAKVNTEYEEKFGFIYIVYATGKGGQEMIEIARNRMGNDRDTEIANAAVEQRRITATRLRQMLCLEDS